jgi:hypothetical protein
MAAYIFIFHSGNFDDTATHRCELEFADDPDALKAARDAAKNCTIDLWCGTRLVAQVKKG